MTEPQVWTALGILLAFLTATLTIVTRTITVQVGSVRSEIDGLRTEMTVRFEAVHDTFNARFDRVQDQISTLDRDVQSLADRVFRDERP